MRSNIFASLRFARNFTKTGKSNNGKEFEAIVPEIARQIKTFENVFLTPFAEKDRL
jgi:hypothetical protein